MSVRQTYIHADLCICMWCHEMTTPVLPRSRQLVHYHQSFSHHLLHLIKSLTIVALNTVLSKLHLCFSAVRCHCFMRQEYILMWSYSLSRSFIICYLIHYLPWAVNSFLSFQEPRPHCSLCVLNKRLLCLALQATDTVIINCGRRLSPAPLANIS